MCGNYFPFMYEIYCTSTKVSRARPVHEAGRRGGWLMLMVNEACNLNVAAARDEGMDESAATEPTEK